jgi:hypothetical protein
VSPIGDIPSGHSGTQVKVVCSKERPAFIKRPSAQPVHLQSSGVVHEEQVGWHDTQRPSFCIVASGHADTHTPLNKNSFIFLHLVQDPSASSVHVLHEVPWHESQNGTKKSTSYRPSLHSFTHVFFGVIKRPGAHLSHTFMSSGLHASHKSPRVFSYGHSRHASLAAFKTYPSTHSLRQLNVWGNVGSTLPTFLVPERQEVQCPALGPAHIKQSS